jgi:putative aldouronate transport system permease protein
METIGNTLPPPISTSQTVALVHLTWRERARGLRRAIWKHRAIYLLMALPLLYFLVFKYWPLWNTQIAFKDFKPVLGVEASPLIGFKHFATFFKSYYFGQL